MAAKIKVTDSARELQMGALVSWRPYRPTSKTSSTIVRETPARWVLNDGRQIRKSDGHIMGHDHARVEVVLPATVRDNDQADLANKRATAAVFGNYGNIKGLESLAGDIGRKIRSLTDNYRPRRVARDDADAICISAGMARERLESLIALVDKALDFDGDE